MNGTPPPDLRLSFHQQQCLDVLREALAEAEQGKVDGLALVLCMPGGWAKMLGGTRPGDLNLGLDDLKAEILANVTGTRRAEGHEVPKPTILRMR